MPFNEADTRSKLIDPEIHKRGWTEDLIRREETAGGIVIVQGLPKRIKGRVDYTLRVQVTTTTQAVAVALIEAKAEHLPPAHGLEQGKAYAQSKRLNVPFVFSSNGHQFVEYDRLSGLTSKARPMSDFPTPAELRARYEQGMGFSLDSEAALPLLKPYQGGDSARRYYQDAAIRATLEKIARGEKRVLLSLATGAGKTRIAVHLLKKIADAGQMTRALFVCDRDELRQQGLTAFQATFGSDAASVSGANPQKNARVLVATYQTLDVAQDDSEAKFLTENYPPDYFSHILIDECHRSAWGKWSEVLTRNPNAVQIGLTATPRQLRVKETDTDETTEDDQIQADNVKHFGEPVYEYGMGQGIEDGYLAACEIIKRNIYLDAKVISEEQSGLAKDDLNGKRLKDAVTGQPLNLTDAKEKYSAASFEASIVLPERVAGMCDDLFAQLTRNGTSPLQKTIIFCTRDSHADAVAIALNNRYATWCKNNGQVPVENFAFKCTRTSNGGDLLPELRGSSSSHFIATTVELLSTGVDIPALRNVVFFKYVKSPISFYQMVGRGTRLDPPTGKLMFTLYDYTGVINLFGKEFITTAPTVSEPTGTPPPPPLPIIEVEGITVQVTDAGKFVLTQVDGRAMPVTLEEYRQQLAAKLMESTPDLPAFRQHWVDPKLRRALLDSLHTSGYSTLLLQQLLELEACDLYDVLAETAYGMVARTREERADAFKYKNATWLRGYDPPVATIIRTFAAQFARSGTDVLEDPNIFRVPEVLSAGGIAVLQRAGMPGEILRETKMRMFAA